MLNEITFLILSAIILVAAIKVVSVEEPVHAAVYLGLVLLGVAGIYLTIGAEFLAAIQVLIYVGAVTTLILFAVMLTTHATPLEGFAEDRTPLSALGIDAPPGMDVEAVEEVPDDVDTVGEAEEEADQEGEGYTVTKEGTEAPDEEPEPEAEEEPDEASDTDRQVGSDAEDDSTGQEPDAEEAEPSDNDDIADPQAGSDADDDSTAPGSDADDTDDEGRED